MLSVDCLTRCILVLYTGWSHVSIASTKSLSRTEIVYPSQTKEPKVLKLELSIKFHDNTDYQLQQLSIAVFAISLLFYQQIMTAHLLTIQLNAMKKSYPNPNFSLGNYQQQHDIY